MNFNMYSSRVMAAFNDQQIDLLPLDSDLLLPSNFKLLLIYLSDKMEESLGFSMKGFTTKTKNDMDLGLMQELDSVKKLIEVGIKVPFLSFIYPNSLFKDIGGYDTYIARPYEPIKQLRALVMPESFKPTTELLMNIVIGIYMSGAYYGRTGEFLHEYYKHLLEIRSPNDEFYSVMEAADSAPSSYIDNIGGGSYAMGLPSFEFMEDMNLLSPLAFAIKYPHGWYNASKMVSAEKLVATMHEGPRTAAILDSSASMTETMKELDFSFQSNVIKTPVVIYDSSDIGIPNAKTGEQKRQKRTRWLNRKMIQNRIRDAARALAALNTNFNRFNKTQRSNMELAERANEFYNEEVEEYENVEAEQLSELVELSDLSDKHLEELEEDEEMLRLQELADKYQIEYEEDQRELESIREDDEDDYDYGRLDNMINGSGKAGI